MEKTDDFLSSCSFAFLFNLPSNPSQLRSTDEKTEAQEEETTFPDVAISDVGPSPGTWTHCLGQPHGPATFCWHACRVLCQPPVSKPKSSPRQLSCEPRTSQFSLDLLTETSLRGNKRKQRLR